MSNHLGAEHLAKAGTVLGAVAILALPIEEANYTAEELAWLQALDDAHREQFVEAVEDMLIGIRDWAQELLDNVHEAAGE